MLTIQVQYSIFQCMYSYRNELALLVRHCDRRVEPRRGRAQQLQQYHHNPFTLCHDLCAPSDDIFGPSDDTFSASDDTLSASNDTFSPSDDIFTAFHKLVLVLECRKSEYECDKRECGCDYDVKYEYVHLRVIYEQQQQHRQHFNTGAQRSSLEQQVCAGPVPRAAPPRAPPPSPIARCDVCGCLPAASRTLRTVQFEVD